NSSAFTLILPKKFPSCISTFFFTYVLSPAKTHGILLKIAIGRAGFCPRSGGKYIRRSFTEKKPVISTFIWGRNYEYIKRTNPTVKRRKKCRYPGTLLCAAGSPGDCRLYRRLLLSKQAGGEA